MNPTQIIAALNSLGVGEVDVVFGRLEEARRACIELDLDELAGTLDEARAALRRADMVTYRKRVETVVSRLGHLK